jgi:hypothetical protein
VSSLTSCYPLIDDGFGQVLNPCGLIANSLFNDQIKTSTPGFHLQTNGIIFPILTNKYNQPNLGPSSICKGCTEKFVAVKAVGSGDFGVEFCEGIACPISTCDYWLGPGHDGCKSYFCSDPELFNCDGGAWYAFFYPLDNTTKYLYESFPEVISPLQGTFIPVLFLATSETSRQIGVRNQHFQVWMQTSAFSKFRNLYGRIEPRVIGPANLTFSVVNNWDASLSNSKKFLVLSTATWFGGEKHNLATSFIAVGTFALATAVSFFAKNCACPRRSLVDDLDLLEERLSRRSRASAQRVKVNIVGR